MRAWIDRHEFRKLLQRKRAVFSDCGAYRYALQRKLTNMNLLNLEDNMGGMAFVMLNPSTADASNNDPTVTRCMNYAIAWGYSTLYVLNIFAYRATDPKEMIRAHDPEGVHNKLAFASILPLCNLVVCAWGVHGLVRNQQKRALEWIEGCGKTPYVLGITKDGQPKHPLYLRKDLKPYVWP